MLSLTDNNTMKLCSSVRYMWRQSGGIADLGFWDISYCCP